MAKVIDDAITTMIANLPEKTGKTLDQWVAIATSTGKTKHGEIVAVLKSDHGLTHGYANLVARRTLEAGSDEPGGADDLVSTQYAGARAGLKPLYDAIIATAQSFGPDIEVDPKKAYVSLRRKKQFALVQPSTAKRLDLGLNLKGLLPKAAWKRPAASTRCAATEFAWRRRPTLMRRLRVGCGGLTRPHDPGLMSQPNVERKRRWRIETPAR